jgi:hypothetical protein
LILSPNPHVPYGPFRPPTPSRRFPWK